jgi:hypothetical protein
MSLSRSDVQEHYTRGIDRYASFIAVFQSPEGMQTLLLRSNLLRAGLRVLDAGCGFGMVTFAVLRRCTKSLELPMRPAVPFLSREFPFGSFCCRFPTNQLPTAFGVSTVAGFK